MPVTPTKLTCLEYVHALAGQFSRLRLLADFASPNIRIRDYHSDGDVARRMTKVNVTVVDLGSSSVERSSFNDLDSLNRYLRRKLLSGSLRVIVTEDLSRDIIELLGSEFCVDPQFFENHLRGIQNYLTDKWTGDRTPRVESSQPEVHNRGFVAVNLATPYRFRGWSSAYSLRMRSNMPRFGGVVRNLYLRERTSLYGPIETPEGCSVCTYHATCHNMSRSQLLKLTISQVLIVCDPQLDDDLPDGIYLRSNGPIPRYSKDGHIFPAFIQHRESTRSIVVNALIQYQNAARRDAKTLLLHTILKLALDFNTAALAELRICKFRMDSIYAQRPRNSYQSMLDTLNKSGGRATVYEIVHDSLQEIASIYAELLPPGESRRSIELELRYLGNTQSEVQHHSARILDFLRQEQEVRDAQNLLMLTRIAILFVPFSTIATILSIPDANRFVAFVSLAIPISIVLIFFTINASYVAATKSNIVNILPTRALSHTKDLISRIWNQERSNVFNHDCLEGSGVELQSEFDSSIYILIYSKNPLEQFLIRG